MPSRSTPASALGGLGFVSFSSSVSRKGEPCDSRASAAAASCRSGDPTSKPTSSSLSSRAQRLERDRVASLDRHRLEQLCRGPAAAGSAPRSSARNESSQRMGGGSGGRSSSRSSGPLSASAHCRSSIQITSGRRSASRPSSSRSAAKPRRRSSCGSALSLARRGRRRQRYAPEHREHAAQRSGVARQQRVEPLGRERREVAAQVVDHLVERFERHELVRIAARPQHERALRGQVEDEALGERGLAEAGRALDRRHRRPARAQRRPRLAQPRQLARTPDEGRAARRTWRDPAGAASPASTASTRLASGRATDRLASSASASSARSARSPARRARPTESREARAIEQRRAPAHPRTASAPSGTRRAARRSCTSPTPR